MRLALLIGLVATTLAGCSRTGAEQAEGAHPQRLAGCYGLELWPGESGTDVERRRAAWGSAPTVKLDTVRLTAWPSLLQQYGQDVFVAHSITDEGRVQDHPFAYWRFIETDSLFVGHPRALAGVSMELVIEGQDLRGVTMSFTDVSAEGPSTSRAPVLARRIECPEHDD
jgi:hypothetical protein